MCEIQLNAFGMMQSMGNQRENAPNTIIYLCSHLLALYSAPQV